MCIRDRHLEDMDKISKDKDVVLIDVRTVCEFSRGHIDGFKNLSLIHISHGALLQLDTGIRYCMYRIGGRR